MMSPLKLSVIVCGAAAGLAVAPYMVKQVLPPAPADSSTVAIGESAAADSSVILKVDLPVAGAESRPASAPAAVVSPVPAVPDVTVAQHELALPATALPSPAAPVVAAQDQSLPSLAAPVVASATLPAPVSTPLPTPRPTPVPTPVPTPEIPFRKEVESAQNLMKELGIDTGKVDGKLGPNTQKAVRAYQEKNGLDATGEVNSDLLAHMEKAVAAKATPTPEPEAAIAVTDAADAEAESADEDSEMKISQADDPATLIVRKADVEEDVSETESDEPKADTAPKVVAKSNTDPGPVPTLQTMDDVKKLQARLKDAGTYDGDVDGKWGDLTRQAMRDFQEKAGLDTTGKPNKETWLALNSEAPVEESNTSAESDKTEVAESDNEGDAEEEYVVTVNGDGSTKPGAKEPIATPRSVGKRDEKSDAQDATDTAAAPIKVATPKLKKSSSSKSDDSNVNDLAVAREDREKEHAELRKAIQSARAEVKSVSNDSSLEVKKYAPKILETVNDMASGLDDETDDAEGTRETISRIQEELKKARQESSKKKAEVIVEKVRSSYKSLKSNFPERIKILSLSDEEEKEQRKKITDYVADIDAGYEAMEKDFKNEDLDHIFEKGEGFRKTIDGVNSELARNYVQDKLSEKDVKSKLSKDKLADIEELMDNEEHLEAAEQLDKLVSSNSSKKKR